MVIFNTVPYTLLTAIEQSVFKEVLLLGKRILIGEFVPDM